MEIARTSLWGFYCRKGTSWTQITTDWEHLCGLKMIKSWRFHFSKQKRSAILLFSQKIYFLTKLSYQQLSEELSPIIYSNHLSKVAHDSVLAETYMNALNFFSCSLKYYSSPLYIQNKTFGTFFFLLISFKELQNLKTAEGKLNQCRIRPSSC